MITLVLTYYDNPRMLARQIKEWRKYDPRTIEVVLVDDCSLQSDAAEEVARAGGAGALQEAGRLQVYRVQVHIPWNQDGCRNLAMREARTPWAFMTDIDHVLPADQVPELLRLSREGCDGEMYMPDQRLTNGKSLHRPHPNSYLIARRVFWSIGGYDEDFAGYYGSDRNFRDRACAMGLRPVYTPSVHVTVYRSSDITDACTRDLGRKGTEYDVRNVARLVNKGGGRAYVAQDAVRFSWERTL